MNKRIIYQNDAGGVSVLIPAGGCGLTLDQIAAKDVPSGRPFRIIDATDLPQDRTFRAAWTVDLGDLTDGIGGASQ